MPRRNDIHRILIVGGLVPNTTTTTAAGGTMTGGSSVLGDGVVATVTFTAASTATGTINLTDSFTDASDASANVIFGAVIDESLKGDVRVTVIATGFGAGGEHRRWRATRKGEPRRETAPETFEVPSEVLEIPSFLRED